MDIKKHCVFCGNKPENKNKEHVLPQWLLKMTGNPKRVVSFGLNYPSGREIKFDWSSFVVPSCEQCNSNYSKLEARAKYYVECLLKREALNSSQYMDLLDWLDKVRVSVWLAYRTFEGNPARIEPNFYVNSRISKKDRMLAVYSFPGHDDGLNAFGVNTLCFHSAPTAFGLRINDIFILNMSSDYLFSSRCGFPSPKIMETHLDGANSGMLLLHDFHATRKIKHPIIRKQIIKPSIHLYQPIMAPDTSGYYQSGFLGDNSLYDSFISKYTLDNGKGVLFLQSTVEVKPILDQSMLIEFEEVSEHNSKTLGDVMSQVLDFQNYIYGKSVFKASNQDLVKYEEKRKKIFLKMNRTVINKLKRVATTSRGAADA